MTDQKPTKKPGATSPKGPGVKAKSAAPEKKDYRGELCANPGENPGDEATIGQILDGDTSDRKANASLAEGQRVFPLAHQRLAYDQAVALRHAGFKVPPSVSSSFARNYDPNDPVNIGAKASLTAAWKDMLDENKGKALDCNQFVAVQPTKIPVSFVQPVSPAASGPN